MRGRGECQERGGQRRGEDTDMGRQREEAGAGQSAGSQTGEEGHTGQTHWKTDGHRAGQTPHTETCTQRQKREARGSRGGDLPGLSRGCHSARSSVLPTVLIP